MSRVASSNAAPRVAVSFVVPVRNDAVRLRRCLDSIRAAADGTSVECIVADNGSTDESAAVAAAAGARVLSLPDVNVSTLRNRAAGVAGGGILAFVDADHEIAPEWTAAAVELFREDGVGAAGALYLPPPDGTWVQRLYGALRGRTVGRGDVEWLGSGNLAVRRSAFVGIGGFDASLGTCEDVDLCQRLTGAGWRLIADERLCSVHLGDPRTLGALFTSERWRGRDNLRSSFRSAPALRDLPSILIPVADIVSLVAILAALPLALVYGTFWLIVAVVGLALIFGSSALRAARMIGRERLSRPTDLFRAWLVALAYDAGRACALVWPASHRARAAVADRSA